MTKTLPKVIQEITPMILEKSKTIIYVNVSNLCRSHSNMSEFQGNISYIARWIMNLIDISHTLNTCSKSAIRTLEQGVKYFQS